MLSAPDRLEGHTSRPRRRDASNIRIGETYAPGVEANSAGSQAVNFQDAARSAHVE